ncbi:hypothetical protein UFOVP967_35 [uncultured Caudovirales phage]|uniref:Uncharacterized protein n=1 Tax=uncultured Caudovirales phage TaxID=2100421 RepID=A0A6J5QZX8_9CAUD|nr:hypothetical protein UFOVP521_81 [uncultured Caudovirales phage]CAB4167744.1 hypothetical protein UFOVP856_53 [uncultured Caudovirales phage]CAB4174241.1 hypothetical protein UFOVP967_35 [uncultured Caudovirales phage]CAB4180535.1 hypothetical protein UFOVP1036_46 [uncultured Caudovirales phage]CAB4186165.1 hypothetical protein UFOVP1132_21 [uncultured Caudovirales phage]
MKFYDYFYMFKVDMTSSDLAVKKQQKKKKHPGFKAVAQMIASKEGYSIETASAILASRTRHASSAAKAANPRLRRVK